MLENKFYYNFRGKFVSPKMKCHPKNLNLRSTDQRCQPTTPADERNAYLKNSALRRHVKKITLLTNMRANLFGDVSAQSFVKQLLNMCDSKHPVDP